MKRILTSLALCLGVAGINAAHAQSWPNKTVTMIVPFTAGTTSDVIARSFTDYLSNKLGKGVIIDNRGGAGGNIGGAAAARSAPDGYTFFFSTTGPAATNKLMYKQMSFDPQKDFVPVVLIGKSPVIIVARQNLPAKDLGEMLAATKVAGKEFSVAYPGNGTLGHITGALLQANTGSKLIETQHRGSASIITDLLGGHLDLGIDSMAAYVTNVQDGKIRALAVASSKRWPKLPDTPTVSEAGIPGFEASVWYAVLAPKGVSPEIVSAMNAHANAFLAEPKTKELFAELGIEPSGGTPAQLTGFIESEIEKWGPVIEASGIKF
jgi:tripartite-type tricarboxylate transporter receptor subunit TctC